MDTPTTQRHEMVRRQIAGRGIRDPAVLAAMRKVAREAFVPPWLRAFAYDDNPLPIGEGQTISQPYVVALMLGAAALGPGDRALEVGTGSGYASALMAEIAATVVTIERHAALAEAARQRLAALGYRNVAVHAGDGTLGWPDAAPYQAIVAAAGGPGVPAPWREQLAVGGRLVMPVGGSAHHQRLIKLTRRGASEYDREDLGAVSFVPLIGAHGWDGGQRDA